MSDEVHVWTVSLDVPRDRCLFLESLLSPEERERADRYLVRTPRERFVVTRGTLREVLSRGTGLPPEQLRFSYPCVCGRPDCAPSRRKPRLEVEDGLQSPRFNVAHTDGLALLAVSACREVGIDVERIDRDAAIGPIAERAFGEDDLAALRALPDEQQAEAFYRGWTRKEAYAKGTGHGLVPGDNDEAGRWSFCDLRVPAGYVASLAIEGSECVVRYSDEFSKVQTQ
jgi:4'-phosphopantetheinyl transferase